MKTLYKLSKRHFNYYLDFHGDKAMNKILKNVDSLNYQNLSQYGLASTQDFLHPDNLYKDNYFAQTFVNEVIACVMDKKLLVHDHIMPEAKEMAKYYLKDIVVGAYSESTGVAKIRQNFKLKLEEEDGVSGFDIKNVYLTSGSINALDHIATTIFQPGDQFMIPNPINANILNYNKSKDINMIEYRVDEGEIIISSLQNLYNKYSKLSPIKAFLFSNPHEPTGRVYSRNEIESVIKFCFENNLTLISWEASKQLIHDPLKTKFESTIAVLNSLGEPYKSKVELFEIYSSSKGYPNVSSIRSACFTTVNIDPQVNAEIYKYKSIDLCSSVPSQVVFDMCINKNMFRLLGTEFKRKYDDSIVPIKQKLINTKDIILKSKNENFEIGNIDSGYNMFTKLKSTDTRSFITNYYKKYNEGLVSPGYLYGKGNEEYVNILINPNGDYGFLRDLEY